MIEEVEELTLADNNCPVYTREADGTIQKWYVCGKEVAREDMLFTHDCHGITYRLVCFDCYEKLMEKGYDGEYYSEAYECLDYDY